jgi:hypothetical protein
MYTNEFLMEASVTTVMDDTGGLDDVQLVINDNNVVVRQWNEMMDDYDYVAMTHKMWRQLLEALDKSEGVFK